MQRAQLFGRDAEMQGSPWTFVVYHKEFGGDLLVDIVAAEQKNPLELYDFLKFAWAMCRTYDETIPGFKEWCNSFEDFTLSDGEGSAFVSVVNSAIEAELFRNRAPRHIRWWRSLRARWMGWLS